LNREADFESSDDILSNIIVFYFIIFTSSIFLNTCWLLTNLASLLTSVGLLCYYRAELQMALSTQAVVSVVLILLLLQFTTYYCERRHKQEFVQLRYNQRLNLEMCQMIENVPEGIIIYNHNLKDIVMANQESRRLFKGYNVGSGCPP
jgi:c-di-AMP phosphodiesterase-like protein